MGEIMPDRKFWVFAYGGEHDDDPYGRGLASHLYWPVFFKRHAGEFWSIALERFGSPTTVGKYPPQALEADKKAALEAAQAASSDRSIAIPSSVELELLEAGQRAGGDYERFLRYWDAAIAKIILSQTMTTDDGSSRAQAQVHLDVREDVVKADADLICRSFNASVVAWLTEWNFPGAVPPRVWRDIEPPADLDARAVRDKALVEAGLQPTQDYVTETYGDGWEIAAAPPSPADQARYMPAQPRWPAGSSVGGQWRGGKGGGSAGGKGGAKAKGGAAGPRAAENDADALKVEKGAFKKLSLTDDETAVVGAYAMNGFDRINRGLRDGDVGEMKPLVDNLDTAIAKSVTAKPVVVARGVPSASRAFGEGGAENAVGKVLADPGYTSTSLNREVAKNFSAVGDPDAAIMEIKVPAGAPALSMRRAMGGSDEHEVLLPRNAALKITGIREETVTWWDGGEQSAPLRIVEAEYVGIAQ